MNLSTYVLRSEPDRKEFMNSVIKLDETAEVQIVHTVN